MLSAETEDGAAPTTEQLDQAAAIIRQRVDASGVAEADITTEGGRNIVVQIPGAADEQTRERIQSSAQLEFRPVLATTTGTNQYVGEDGNSTAYPSPDDSVSDTPTAEPTDASDLSWVTDKLAAEYQAYDCANPDNDPSNAPKDEPLIACDPTGGAKFLLGPTELTGDAITDATAGRDPQSGAWLVQLTMNADGAEAFGEVSTRLNQNRLAELAPRDQFAFVLDGSVISAPRMNGQILDGRPSISGSFTQETATTLADQLKFGALPLSFEVQSSDTVSATLGTQQLQIGLIAGLIGLALVAIYSLIVYRALGTVIIASIAVMAILTYVITLHPGLETGLPSVSRRRRGSDRVDRIHSRLVHRLLRENPRRAPRRQVDHLGGRRRLGQSQAHDLHLEVDQHPGRCRALHPRGCNGEGLRVHAGSDDPHRRVHLRDLHAPGDAAARSHEVLRWRTQAVGP